MNDWLYIYYISADNKHALYDRSMPWHCVREADARVTELRKRGHKAFYTTGCILPSALS